MKEYQDGVKIKMKKHWTQCAVLLSAGETATMRIFTLIELLIVISVIAILISLLLPSLGKARDTAKRIKCTANLKQINTLAALYYSDNNGFTPPYRIKDLKFYTTGPDMPYSWYEILNDYLSHDTQHASNSAGDRKTLSVHYQLVYYYSRGKSNLITKKSVLVWGCDGLRDFGYAINMRPNSERFTKQNEGISLSRFKQPASLYAFADPVYVGNGYGAFDQNSEYERFKHPGRTANFSFADGHVENRPYSKFGANYNLNKEKWLADPSL